jgi:hypothetical protein
MKTNKIVLLLVASCVGMAIDARAATVPSGTVLVVKTTTSLSSYDNAGKKFTGHLVRGVTAKGNIALPAGTEVVGVVQSPYVSVGSTSRPMTLKLTGVSVRGQMVAINTQPYEAVASGVAGKHGGRATGNRFVFPPGTILQFQLSQSANL